MQLLEKDNCSTYDTLAASAAKIAYYNFKWQYASFIFFNAPFFCGVNVFVKLYNKNVIIGQHIYNPWFIENTAQFILFVKNNADIIKKLEWLANQKYNNAGRYLIICYAENGHGCDETEAVKVFWHYRIGNVILIKYDYLQRINGYTFFQDDNCGPSPARKLKHWDSCIFKDNRNDCEKYMFPIKFKNLLRCPLIVSTFRQEPYMMLGDGVPTGADGDLLNIIIEALNATLVLVTPRQGDGWGSLESNGTWSGSLGDIYYDWANLSMTSASITLHRFQFFQMSRNYNTISVVWVTHPSDFQPSYLKLLRPYSVTSRFALIVILTVVISIGLCLKINIRKSFQKSSSIISNNIILDSWQICMSLPVTRLPKNWFYKYSILFWIWFCFLLRTYYQVHLINALQTDVRTTNVYTIEDAINTGYLFGGGLALKDYFIEQPIIYKKWKIVESNEIEPIMFELSRGMKFVLAMNLETTNIFLGNPNRKLHILPQKIVSSPTVIFFKKYSWLAQSINRVLTRLFEAGIPNKLLQDFISKGYQVADDVNKPIKLEHFQGCFAILILGWILSCVVAIIEKILYIIDIRLKLQNNEVVAP